MTNILLSGESIDKTKEAGTFAFLITDVIIPEGMKRVDVVDCLAASGIYSGEDDLAYGSDESDEAFLYELDKCFETSIRSARGTPSPNE